MGKDLVFFQDGYFVLMSMKSLKTILIASEQKCISSLLTNKTIIEGINGDTLSDIFRTVFEKQQKTLAEIFGGEEMIPYDDLHDA